MRLGEIGCEQGAGAEERDEGRREGDCRRQRRDERLAGDEEQESGETAHLHGINGVGGALVTVW